MISTAELAKLTLRILGRGIPTSRCSVKRKWVKTKMECPKILMMGRYFSLWKLSFSLANSYLPHHTQTKQNKICVFYITLWFSFCHISRGVISGWYDCFPLNYGHISRAQGRMTLEAQSRAWWYCMKGNTGISLASVFSKQGSEEQIGLQFSHTVEPLHVGGPDHIT